MRLHRLEIEGFGPFRERQSVDFDAFAADGIFLIAGRTGAGKSSILDAVCFGLYGGVPRYESGEKRLRSDHCEPDDISEVVVEFSTTAGRFRVTRSPEYLRPAKRGGGMTKQQAAVSLEERIDGAWVGRAARAVDAGNELKEILQLTQEQFLQVILLAQNRFARFLLADSKERQALLRRLFGTERFEDVHSRFEDRRKRSENALGARLATVEARLEDAESVVAGADLWGARAEGEDASPGAATNGTIDERLAALETAAARARYRAERAGAEREATEQAANAADAALSTAREQQKAQRERERARAALEALDAEAPVIAAAREELDRARSAESLRSVLLAVTRAEGALALAVQDESIARECWAALDEELPDGTSLQDWAAEQTRLSGAWGSAVEAERDLPGLDSELTIARLALAESMAQHEADAAERAALPAQVKEIAAERDDARRAADRVDELERAQERALARLAAVQEGARLAAVEIEGRNDLDAAGSALLDAQAALVELRRRRLAGYSGELAAALIPGAPCPVCGSPEHPQPAVHVDPVSEEDVAAAEAVRDAAAATERGCSERVAALVAELAAVTARADGSTAESADADAAAAALAVDGAQAAAEKAAALELRVTALAQRADQLESAGAAAAADLAQAREGIVALEERIASARTRVEQARGDFESVAERVAAAAERIAAAGALASALAERDRRRTASDDAMRERDDALNDSVFEGVSDVEHALRPAGEQEQLEARITAHTVQREKEREILLDLELQALPEDMIDLAPQEQGAREAREAWKLAVDTAARADGVAERLSGLIGSAAQEHARSAAQAGEHEVLKSLADTIAGRGANTHRMTLETFVLAAELEEIVAAANRRLAQMQDGRYQLRHSDALAARGAASGLGIVVHDAFTGQVRPAQSLSGGETFLSSLALALGLAEVVTARAGGIQLDTLFIDEGFGSLDADTLEVAMRTLDELRAGGRTVGVISHVEAMQEQIPAQLRVERTEAGPSRIIG